jgi:hypothetical protein
VGKLVGNERLVSRLLVRTAALDQFLGFAQKVPVFGVLPLRLFHGFPQSIQRRLRFVLLAQLMLRHGQEGKVRRLRAFLGGIAFRGLGQRGQGVGIALGTVLGDAQRVEGNAIVGNQTDDGLGLAQRPRVGFLAGVAAFYHVPRGLI